jgi:transcriptional regulator with XRE-family HTH domain
MPRRQYMNEAPKAAVPEGAPRDTIKLDFAKRLQRAMVKKGWNQSELARRAQGHLKEGRIERDNISHWIRGVAIPLPAKLAALCKALGVEPMDLLPTAPTVSQKAPAFDMRQLEDGNVWLRINQAVSFDQALQIMQIVNEREAA